MEAEVKKLIFDLDEAELAEFNVKFLKTDKVARVYAPFCSFAYGAFLAMLLFVFLRVIQVIPLNGSFFYFLCLIVYGGLLAAVTGLIYIFIRFNSVFIAKLGFGKLKAKEIYGRYEISLQPKELECICPARTLNVPYAELERIEEDELRSYIFLDRKKGLVIAASKVRSGNCEEFLAELERRMASAKATHKPTEVTTS